VFCDPKGNRGTQETDIISSKINQAMTDFRKFSLQMYHICYGSHPFAPDDIIGFYNIKPDWETDIKVVKDTDSAFATKFSMLDQFLKTQQHSNLLITGFNLNSCVYQTCVDARKKGFNVILLEDLVGNDRINDENPQSYKASLEKDYDVSILHSNLVLNEFS